MEVGGGGRHPAVQEFDGGVGVGQDLLGPGDEPVPDLHNGEISGGVGIGGDRGAILGRGQALDLLQALAVDAVDVTGPLAEMGDGKRAVLAGCVTSLTKP